MEEAHGGHVMLVTDFTRDAMKARHGQAEKARLIAEGWEEVGEGGGRLWELHRGWRHDHVITSVTIAPDGKSLLIKTRVSA